MARNRPLALLLATALPLQACAVGPDYAPPSSAGLGVPAGYSTANPGGTLPDITTWWTRFNDPLLTGIVERARANNLDIAQGVARLRQAREGLAQARGAALPSVSGSAGYNRFAFDNVGDRDNFSLGADASYQAGIFGEIRRNVEANRATYAASGYDLATVQTSVASEVARNYILVRNAQTDLQIARDSLRVQDENLEITGFRVQAGLVSSLDVEQSRAQRAQTAAQIPIIEQNLQAAINRLGVLTGQAPGALRSELTAARPIPVGQEPGGIGVPADVLRQRPDVRAAERTLAANTAAIGVEQAALYPALNITGNIGTAASSIGSLTNLVTGGLFAGLTQLIFDGGRTRSRVRAQRAAAEGALANYKQVVLIALEDVENALTALQAAKDQQREFAVALDAARNTAILARSQYRTGLTDITTLNTAEASLLSAQNGLADARASQASALVQLYLALGGGWDATTVPTATPARASVPARATSQD
ncbi:efflux transporter outer membrane subunit [Sphingomonas aracearum]|uniref:RND transporter n=1 Tax=Sphingomonas aracearum TaxID=2283317 RepID=A0A369VW42_9SPHN|nr:efflux transporter outer membrane subunit [Sphingomonas aracearum]RDE05390.1 RND transporter [Sphingomonas aracearum]